MKTQIKFQKVLSLLTLIIAAVAFVYVISFFSGNLSDMMYYRTLNHATSYLEVITLTDANGVEQTFRFTNSGLGPVVTADFLDPYNTWIYAAQSAMSTLVVLCIVFFVIIALAYILCMNSRRNYYISNYVMSGIIIAYAAFLAIFGLAMVISLMSSFYEGAFYSLADSYANSSDLETVARFMVLQMNGVFDTEISDSPLMFILGIVAFVLVLVVALAWVYNLIWKIKLMKGEKELLAKGLSTEVA